MLKKEKATEKSKKLLSDERNFYFQIKEPEKKLEEINSLINKSLYEFRDSCYNRRLEKIRRDHKELFKLKRYILSNLEYFNDEV